MKKETVERLKRQWRVRLEEYKKFMFDKKLPENERQRYEGIAMATRWCLEDLENRG